LELEKTSVEKRIAVVRFSASFLPEKRATLFGQKEKLCEFTIFVHIRNRMWIDPRATHRRSAGCSG
jgi:hypothetical protein